MLIQDAVNEDELKRTPRFHWIVMGHECKQIIKL